MRYVLITQGAELNFKRESLYCGAAWHLFADLHLKGISNKEENRTIAMMIDGQSRARALRRLIRGVAMVLHGVFKE